jgi:hypothetical protein
MKNITEGEMITAFQRMVNRMKLLALGLNVTNWTMSVQQNLKNALQRTG